MNYIIAKIKGADNTYEKLCSAENVYKVPSGLDSAITYNPETVLEEDDWYEIKGFSSTSYCIDILKNDFRTTDYKEADRIKTGNVDYIVVFEKNKYFFQRVFKNNIMTKKRITLGDNIKLKPEEESIVINSLPDAIYDKGVDVLYFKKLSTISPIFVGIDELYREATEEETSEFLESDFIELVEGYNIDNVKKSNRKRIAMVLKTLKEFDRDGKQKLLFYTHEYCPELKYNKYENVFTIGSENDLKHLLWGIEQRYYTTPVTHEERVANSIIKL